MSTHPDPKSRPAAVPVAGRSARPRWLLPLILGLLAVIALLAVLSQCGGDDDDKERAAAPTATASLDRPDTPNPVTGASAAVGATDSDQSGARGTVTAAGTNLLGAATAADLRSHEGQEARGRAVKVQSVPADEGFWVGTSEQDRLWVQLSGTRGESDYKVTQGDTVDFTGTVTRAADGFAAARGVTAAEGGDQLTAQGYYVSAPSSSITLSD